ncbi:MAG: HipA family kinase [Bryobacteraceae bacterium]
MGDDDPSLSGEVSPRLRLNISIENITTETNAIVGAKRLDRKMRGGAQAHLIEADNGHYYVVKFRNNPQHRRILLNEWVAGMFLRCLGITTPDTAVIDLSEEFLQKSPDVCIRLGSNKVRVEPGRHFGSAYPGAPDRDCVYDFLPDVLLDNVVNLSEFLGVLAFDKWAANTDSRQSIFYRLKRGAASGGEDLVRKAFVVSMIDHGSVFDGGHWTYADSPLQGLYFRPLVYMNVRSFEDFQPWLDRIVHFPSNVVDDALKQVPAEWLDGDDGALNDLLTRLMARCNRVPDLIRESTRGRVNPFPNWK